MVDPSLTLAPELAVELDRKSRRDRRPASDLLNEAVTRYLADDVEERQARRREIDRQYVDGYTRYPPKELWDGEANLRGMIEAEPW